MTATRGSTVTLQRISGDADLLACSVVSSGSAAGMVLFDVTVRNARREGFTVTNPYEGTSYHLIDGGGSPVQVQEPPNRAKVHVARDPVQRQSYLDLTAVTLDGAAVTADEFIRSASIDLASGHELVLSLAVRSSVDPADRSPIEYVPAGDYHLVVMLRAVVTAGGTRHPLLLRTAHDVPVTVDAA